MAHDLDCTMTTCTSEVLHRTITSPYCTRGDWLVLLHVIAGRVKRKNARKAAGGGADDDED